MFGSAKFAALIQAVLALSVVFVCSGLFSTEFSSLKLRDIWVSYFYASSVV